MELTIHPNDNVCVELTGTETIPVGHKKALCDIPQGTDIVKYGFPIGHATEDIPKGAWVHSHNMATNLAETLTYTYEPQLTALAPAEPATFLGYPRSDGQVGIRNEIWIINTVGCVNETAARLAREASALYGDRVDGIYTFRHPYGCSQLGEDHDNTRHILADLVHHPNAAGVLVLSLGCENNTPASFRTLVGPVDPERVRFLTTQEVEDEIAEGLKILDELTLKASLDKRQPFPASRLVIGLKCGGSDGFSGITANPLIGQVSDLLAAQGGTTVLTEVPEMFGAETILMSHCKDAGTFQKTVCLINDFKEYFTSHGQVVYENPSPGNKAGGITTLEEKSLGCTQKGGCGTVQDVLRYGARVQTPGLNLLQGPGNDIVACTALASAGCHLILFSTGRGTPLGGPVPTIKVATNSALAKRKTNWIDYNAGTLLEDPDMEKAGSDFFRYILEVASGRATCNEKNGYREIAIWKDGVTL